MINAISFRNITKQNYNSFKAIPRYSVSFGSNNNQYKPVKAPLTKDMVCLSNKTTTEIKQDNRKKALNKDLMHAFDNQDICQQVYEEAEPASKYIKGILTSNLNNMVINKNNPNGVIAAIDVRIKTPDSIREKIASELGAAITAPTPYAFNPNKKEEIKAHCGDLVGARVVMADASQKNNGKVLNALIEDIKSGKLKVTSIEHYVSKDNSSLDYFSEEDLEKLKDAVNEQRASKGLDAIEVATKVKPSGYTALHLDVNITSSNFIVKNDSFKGEIQFIGYDVCQFKELEDLCYKISSDKDIKSGNYSYAPFAEHFKHQMANEAYPNLKQDFLEYTRRAYEIQRKKAPQREKFVNGKIKSKVIYPSIEECGMEGKIPPGLDFNLLNKIKASCDNIYKNTTSFAHSEAA